MLSRVILQRVLSGGNTSRTLSVSSGKQNAKHKTMTSKGDCMSDTPSTFKQQWEAKKLLKRAKKKAKHQLQKEGFSKSEATKQVNSALNRIVANPIRKASGRGG